MGIKLGVYEFRPRLLATLATVLGLLLFLSLGEWQLARAKQKQVLIDDYAERSRQTPVLIDAHPRSWEAYRYRQGTARGRYDLKRQLLLDNRIQQGRAGYHVLTPLLISGAKTAVLVNRGWVPVGGSRARLPQVPGPSGEVSVAGIIDLPPPQVFLLGSGEEAADGWPLVIQALQPERITHQLGYPVLPVVLLLDPEDEYGFVRDWKPVYGIGPERHRAYAVQWFSFAIVLAGIYVGVNTRRIL